LQAFSLIIFTGLSEGLFAATNLFALVGKQFMNDKKNILVTGGAGFIGSHLVENCSPKKPGASA
jgi:NADPH:quinone reductase-like Zn-dependent oxidoreductase